MTIPSCPLVARVILFVLLAGVPCLRIEAQENAPTSRPAFLGGDDPTRRALPSTTPTSERFRAIVAICEAKDPTKDVFPTEVLATRAEERLSELSRRLPGIAPAASAPASGATIFADGAEAPALEPADNAVVFRDGTAVVTRSKGGANASASLNAAEAFDRLIAHFIPGSVTIETMVTSVTDGGADQFSTTVVVTIFGNVKDGQRQINTTWNVEWRKGDAPLIRKISVLAFETVTLTAPFFVDRTERVLANAQTFADRVRVGADHRRKKTDAAVAGDTLAHTGIAIGDVNGDGLDDLYVPMPGGVPNALLIHQPDDTVIESAAAANVDFLDQVRSALLVDLDNDGDQDLVIGVRNALVLFANDGKGTFATAPTASYFAPNPADIYSIAAGDVDRNGFVDFYATRYMRGTYGIAVPLPYFDAENGPTNHLLTNDGKWHLTDVTDAVGLSMNNNRCSLAASFEDVDDDGALDLYVANDFGRSNLYVQRNGKFTDEIDLRGAANLAAGMGVSFADFDGDGVMDLYVSNMYSAAGARLLTRPDYRPTDTAEERKKRTGQVMGNAIFRGLGGGKFEDVSMRHRREVGGWSWGGMFVDVNGDGREDILVPNGNLTGEKKEEIDGLFWRKVASESPWTQTIAPKYVDGWAAQSLLMNRGYSWAGNQRHATFLNCGDGTFADCSAISGFGVIGDARALAVTDWDGDGDLDLWLKSRTAPELRFFENRTRTQNAADRHFVTIRLEGTTSNRQAIGARVVVESGDRKWTKTLHAGDGYLAQSSAALVFGLAEKAAIDRVTVRWPSGKSEKFAIAAIDRAYLLKEGTGTATLIEARAPVVRDDHRIIGRGPAKVVSQADLIALIDRPPMPRILMTSDQKTTKPTDAMLGKAFMLAFWSMNAPSSIEWLRSLSTTKDLPGFADIVIVPVCVDPPNTNAHALLAGAGATFGEPAAFFADPVLLDFVDVLQQEVLGAPDDLVLPGALLVDRLGLVAGLIRGSALPAEIVECIARAPRTPPIAGKTIFTPFRNYGAMASDFRARGRRDFAELYGAIDRRLRSGRK